MRVVEPLGRESLGGGRGLGRAESLLPLVGWPGEERCLHRGGDPGPVLGAHRVVAKRPSGWPVGGVEVGIEVRQFVGEPTEPERLEDPPRVTGDAARDDVEAPAIGALVGAVERVEELRELVELQGPAVSLALLAIELEFAG